MQVKMIDGAIVIEPTKVAGLSPQNFEDKPLTVETEPAFYVALGANGLMERSVSVTVVDRKTVAALVGNWIAEGYQPVPCDLKAYARHVRNLVAANKPAKVETETQPAGNPESGSNEEI
ncbi:uncharacterized protein NMK_2488 [Novimethylophilus kurashikiensis]|uniref:Phage protein n=1 Tax=Novimethylophilus kurashikiensis TaxID=1825523 RepID=A0A2R5F9L3_9PROT|nr:hypothetical protein [Novimethylophilus kurashikiensis]GBG14887.1 uncharacterized protein NMK_2488 [Novimethylophilus kurashikiensis]